MGAEGNDPSAVMLGIQHDVSFSNFPQNFGLFTPASCFFFHPHTSPQPMPCLHVSPCESVQELLKNKLRVMASETDTASTT